jgi:hypothetical protein
MNRESEHYPITEQILTHYVLLSHSQSYSQRTDKFEAKTNISHILNLTDTKLINLKHILSPAHRANII